MKKVFVLGDSISMQYGPYLKEMLSGLMEYDRKRDDGQAIADLDQPVGGNGGDCTCILAYILENRDMLSRYDCLLLNCGLHDLKVMDWTEKRQVAADEYGRYLERIAAELQAIGLHWVWIRTTPVDDDLHNRVKGFRRFNRDVIVYNEIADHVMAKYGIPVLDLYGFTSRLGEGLHEDGEHFTKPVRRLQAAYLAGALCFVGQIRGI